MLLKDDDADQSSYQLIYEAETQPRTDTLAKLRTRELDDGDYQIWLTAQDILEHASFDEIMFRVDNTLPSVSIVMPKVNERVLKQISLFALISDIHLDSYRLDYTTDLATNDWAQIYVKAGLYLGGAFLII